MSETRPSYAPPASETPRMQPYPLTEREFEVIRMLRRMHFFDHSRERISVLRRLGGRVILLDCQQVNDG